MGPPVAYFSTETCHVGPKVCQIGPVCIITDIIFSHTVLSNTRHYGALYILAQVAIMPYGGWPTASGSGTVMALMGLMGSGGPVFSGFTVCDPRHRPEYGL